MIDKVDAMQRYCNLAVNVSIVGQSCQRAEDVEPNPTQTRCFKPESDQTRILIYQPV